MATPATRINHNSAQAVASWEWFWKFIRWEVEPYPGRINTVLRMTVSATLVMIIVVTFRIPNPTLSAFFSILVARENLVVSWRGARMVVLGFTVASLYILLGMILFRGFPISHFFWVIGSLYLVFFVMRTTTNYGAAWAFSIPIGIALPMWDRSLPSQIQVEGTLWPIIVIAVGAGVSVGIEALYRIFDHSDPLLTSVDDVLLAVEQVVNSVAGSHPLSKKVSCRILQYQMIGTGRLRTTLQRQGADPTTRAQRSALISFADRLIGFAANLERTSDQPCAGDAMRLRVLSARLGAIRRQIRKSIIISPSPLLEGPQSAAFPALQEMERIVTLMSEVFQRDKIIDDSRKPPERGWWHSLFLPDAFRNKEYQRFAFAGCLSASICYVLYNALDWPGISISVITCIVTALSTIGTSLQAQFLRIAGFVTGGIVMGISAQILILPGIDTVFGFALFFAAGTGIAAWFATSSPRLSFFGIQIALAFYFVNLQDFRIETDLTIARDKLVGVLLGILAMGFIFDRFGPRSDTEQLQKLMARTTRMVAQLGVSPGARDRRIPVSPLLLLRSQINDNLANLASQIDAAQFEFEFRARREQDSAEWAETRRMLPPLRCIYVLQLSLLSHRGSRGVDSQLTPQQDQVLDRFLNEFGDDLMSIAARIEHEPDTTAVNMGDSIRQLEQVLETHSSRTAQAIIDICKTMTSSLLMLRNGR